MAGQLTNMTRASNSGWTPLIAAIYQGNTNVAHYLIASGADVNIPDNSGKTAIMWAMISDDNVDIVKDLIAHGADLNARDKHGVTVLSYASSAPPKPKLPGSCDGCNGAARKGKMNHPKITEANRR